jgi:methylthioxylose transferase
MEARALAMDRETWPGQGRRVALGVLFWGCLIAAAFAWGEILNEDGADILLGAPPLAGRFNPGLEPQALVTLAVAAAIIATAPWLRANLGWRGLLFASFAGAWIWAGALDLLDGGYLLTVPILKPDEYLRDVPLVGSPGTLFSGLLNHPNTYVNHVQTHPPGMLLTLWGMDRIGAGGAWPAALLMMTGGAATVPAALVAGREVMGEERARLAAPFLVLTPAAMWIATSADAFFAGVSCWGAALVILATGREGRRADWLALAGGLLLGLGLMLSYGLVLMWAVPAIVAVARGRLRALAVSLVGPAIVLGGFALAGFWWLDGWTASHNAHEAGIAATRPYPFFFVDDLAAFAVVLGPAVCAGLAGLRAQGERLLVGAALAAVLLADLSGLSKGEVERIWLPFAPFVMLAAAGLPSDRRSTRAWLAGAAAFAAFVEMLVRTAW